MRVVVPGAGTERVVTIDHFDVCNDCGTTVTIAPDASLSSETLTTDLECGG